MWNDYAVAYNNMVSEKTVNYYRHGWFTICSVLDELNIEAVITSERLILNK